MQLYAFKFREKGSKTYLSVVIAAENDKDFSKKSEQFIYADHGYDIDRRTLSWTGPSIPLTNKNEALVIYGDLDDLT